MFNIKKDINFKENYKYNYVMNLISYFFWDLFNLLNFEGCISKYYLW